MSREAVQTFLISFAIFMAVDLVWLGILAQPIYDHFIGFLLADSPNWGGAVAFYLLYMVGMNYFAIRPALEKRSIRAAAEKGAAYGFFTYMTYELTNYAVIQDWPLGLVLIDIAWGVVLGTSVSALTVIAVRHITFR